MVEVLKPINLPTIEQNAALAGSIGFASRRRTRSAFAVLTDFDSISDNICNILFFRKGDYPDLPDFGMGVQDYLFENDVNETFKVAFTQEFRRQIAKYEPRARVLSVNVFIPKYDENAVNIDAQIDILGISFALNAGAGGGFSLTPGQGS